MKKMYKITNIALVFMLIGVFLCQNLVYASHLRLPLNIDDNREKEALKEASRDLLLDIIPSEDEVDLVLSLGVRPGDKAIEIGTGSMPFISILIYALGGISIGIELDHDRNKAAEEVMEYCTDGHNLSRFGGNIKQIEDNFLRYAENEIKDGEFRFVICPAVLTDVRTFAPSHIFSEILRIVQDGGEIVLGRLATGDVEGDEKSVINEVLESREWKGKVRLMEISSGYFRYESTIYTRYKVFKTDKSKNEKPQPDQALASNQGLRKFVEEFHPALHAAAENGPKERAINEDGQFEEVTIYPNACMLGCFTGKVLLQKIYGDRIKVDMFEAVHPSMKKLKIGGHYVLILTDNSTNKTYFLSFFEGIWDDTYPLERQRELLFLEDNKKHPRATLEYIKWFKEQDFAPIFFEFKESEDITKLTGLTIGEKFEASESDLEKAVSYFDIKSHLTIDNWIKKAKEAELTLPLASNQGVDKSQDYELQEVDTSVSLFTDQLIRETKMSMPHSDEKEPDYTVFNEKVKELKKIKSLDVMVLSAREFKHHKEVNVDYETYKWLNSKYLEPWGKKDKFLFHTIQNINQHVKPGIVLVVQQERTTREGVKYTDISVIDNGRGPIDKQNNAQVPIEEIVKYGVSKGVGGRYGVGLTHAVMEAADLSIILTHGNTKLIKGGMSVFRVVLFRPAPKILWQSENEEPYGMTVIGIFCEKKDRKDVEQDVIKRLEELEDIDMPIMVRTKDTLPKFGLSGRVFSVAPLQTSL